MNAPRTTWTRRSILEGLKTMAQKSVMTARPPCTSNPAGVCIQELAMTIQMAEKMLPSATMTVAKKWIFLPTRSQPKTSTERKPDSKKKGEDTLSGQGAAEHV